MKDINTRKSKVWNDAECEWQDTDFVCKGQIYKLFEPDGLPVKDRHGKTTWVAAKDEYHNGDGVRTIQNIEE